MAQIAVIGLGKFGFHAAKRLFEHGHEVLAIDRSQSMVERIKDYCSQAVVLDARDKDRLQSLGVSEFDVVIVSLGVRIEAAAILVLHLKELGVRRVICKAGSQDHARLLELIGGHEIVFPERDSAEHLANRLTNASILDYIPLGDTHSIHELAPSTSLVGKTLAELKLRNRYNVQVLAVRDVLKDSLIINPGADFRVKDSDVLVVLGSNEDLNRLRSL